MSTAVGPCKSPNRLTSNIGSCSSTHASSSAFMHALIASEPSSIVPRACVARVSVALWVWGRSENGTIRHSEIPGRPMWGLSQACLCALLGLETMHMPIEGLRARSEGHLRPGRPRQGNGLRVAWCICSAAAGNYTMSHASPVPVFECTSKPSLSGAARCRPSGCLCWGWV